ncbi:MAG: hypothetical protein PHD15_00730 [Clostridia bacterium]|nr:hypothetical protein [Clostridia bacterium]MDD4386275.1 hypothetical protein [Clostridia bacterium]
MKKGISLIVLVITIIVIIILAGAVILSLANNNPISSANKATCLSDIANLKAAVALDFASAFGDANGIMTTYDPDASIDTLVGKLEEKYGLTITITTTGTTMGAISFALDGAGNLPTGVLVTDL